MTKPALDIRLTEQSDLLWVWEHDGPSRRLVVCFSGIGGETDPTPVTNFASTAAQDGQNSVLFIADPNRTWLNGDGLVDAICGRIFAKAEEVGATQIVTMGHSMGGFSALVIAGMVGADVAIAFSPQLSIDPAVVPDENRWMDLRANIGDIRISSAADYLHDSCTYYVFFGSHPRERPQRDRFPLADNIALFNIPTVVHNSPQRMKQTGVLADVFKHACERRRRKVRLLLQETFGAKITNPPKDAPTAVRPIRKGA
ncbi:hypothetical protein [uncultured Sulfitobacter sp.]|uniref:hypothetical protein n=1 Tax=uncultured Sulfitobacter sp. TaxID=191468 RepID=UPI002637215C|nr:hypothetical protein [uncultured Sulfitobacter sp.]